ncbi:glycosyltransferase family 2 protein [Granulicella tundricola]|uniref:Glycosyl transferase family 2 n=1 Tax=Granulicella tundricola (strain ATCC BAA-1859 / DSM 23138 / MP5ACTX9) TaxID=1198114 RepID=E8WZ52_GRATM|nr:glycosyltransferase family 2 protein [Granulicella tundricola]ADW67654.1 glycosyl transferase family 2 [Granulicella tundricola MP5ACTX9]
MRTPSSLPLISIVTPSLNQAAFLGEAVESVRTQAYPAYQHIVLDGGSSDGSVEILREAGANACLQWRSHPDGGQSAALNEGFQKAEGEIIGWLNADDRYRPGCFEAVTRAFAEHPETDVLYGDYTFMDEAGRHLELRREIEFSHFILKYCHTLYIPTTSTFFRRRVFDEGHFLKNELHYAMDLEFFMRLAEAGYRFRHLPEVLADFRMHAASKSTQFVDRQRLEHRQVVLQATPLAQHIQPMWARNVAATLLQFPADALRYTEKLLRGFYFDREVRDIAIPSQSLEVERP